MHLDSILTLKFDHIKTPAAQLKFKMTAQTFPSNSPFLQINNQGQIIKLDLTQQQHILGRDPQLADLAVPENWQIISRLQAILRRDGQDYYIFDGDGQTPSSNRLYINRSLITPQSGYRLTSGMQLNVGLDPQTFIQITYINPNTKPINTTGVKSAPLDSATVIIGRDSSATLQLDSPTISRCHATIDRNPAGQYILQDRSTNGVFINGQRVQHPTIVAEGAIITISPFTLTIRNSRLEILDRGNQIRLDVTHLTLATNNKTRLDNLSFSLEPGQFIALVGGSGAGKSTLMRTLLGIEAPTSGSVYINGTDLRQNFNIYRNQIGYVPQDDIIHQDLSVEEVLTYAAQLRLPADADIAKVIEQALTDIKMTQRRTALIKELSGGQRKRVSIGVELLANPKLFFLDEPTSGLDPGLDKQMMELLRDLAHNGGRTIILVTHATNNITQCDRIVFLGAGGKLCYFGSPAESLNFFNVNDFADIYIQLEEIPAIDQCVHRYRESPYFQKYIGATTSSINPPNIQSSPTIKQANPITQWGILTKRYFNLIIRDKVNLALALATAPAGISLINFALRDKDPFILGSKIDNGLSGLALQVLFVFTCASLWVGLSSSIQEVVKEAAIYLRERLVNLRILSYIASKVAVLSILAICQTSLIFLTITIGFKSNPSDLINFGLGMAITTFLTLTASFSLGLLVSAAAANNSQANSMLPLLLLPQIIFSGVLFKLEGAGEWLSWAMLSRWSIGAYGTIINVNSLVPKALQTDLIKDLPFPTGLAYKQTFTNLTSSWIILIIHISTYLIITSFLQKRKDIL
jgi:ABC transport system ATP-binding/permease protein